MQQTTSADDIIRTKNSVHKFLKTIKGVVYEYYYTSYAWVKVQNFQNPEL